MTAAPRVIRAFGWTPGIPGSQRHAARIGAARPNASPSPDLALANPDEWAWQDHALCAQVDPEVWYPPKGGASTGAAAKRVCASCPVIRKCLEHALAHCERWGVWGGMTEPERLAELAAREPGVPRCGSGWHPLAGSNLTGDGKCLACDEIRSERGSQARREAKELAA